MVPPEVVESVTSNWPTISAAIAGVGTMIILVWREFKKGLDTPAPASNDLVLTGAQIADMRPIKESAALLAVIMEQQKQTREDIHTVQLSVGELRTSLQALASSYETEQKIRQGVRDDHITRALERLAEKEKRD